MSRTRLSEKGRPWPVLERQMRDLRSTDVDWRGGRAAVYVFHAGDDVLNVAHDAYGEFASENALGPGAFPSLKRMEREVLEMALELQNAPEGAAASMTSGGTESITMALKACRDHVARHGGVPGVAEVVVPRSAHPAFDKAAHFLGMRVVRVPLADGYVADVARMGEAITPSTVMLVGSAPCFPFGVVDPIAALGSLASERELWLHVDACVGGYLAPFVRRLGEAVPDFDFSIAEVTSMSADLHKYGYAAKGASTVLYRDKVYRDAQVFHFDDWPCGHMYTPTLAGTRPGGAVAAAWAVMNYLGIEGYVERAARLVAVRRRLTEAVTGLGLEVLGDPRLSIVTFGGGDVDILAVGEGLYRDGWMSSRTNEPPGIHFMASPFHAEMVEDYVAALSKWVGRARNGELARSSEGIRYA